MNRSIVLWLLLALSTISIFSDVARASATAQCLGIDQRSLLLDLRDSLVFDASSSSKLVHWDRSAGSWSGVTCEEGLVVGLDLSEEWISGGINGSSSLFRLEFLRSLNLAFNEFNSSAIPSGLGNLSRLVHLNLSCAGFAGTIPAELSRLTKLRTLDLSTPYYSDEPVLLKLEKPHLRSLIGDMGELRELYLDGVNVSAEGREWCNALSSSVPKLEVLSMPGCSLSGPIDDSLMSLANLSVIELRVNNLSTTMPRDMNISGSLPDSIGNLRKLSRLNLNKCGLSGSIPSSMESLSELTYLDLSSNNLTGSVPTYGASRNLTQIDLSHNALTGQILSVGWKDLLNLEILDLRNNSLEGNIPSALFTLPRLRTILLSENRFNGQLIIYPNVSSYQLNMLDLHRNQLQGSIPASTFELRGLGYLSLSSNNFNGSMNIDALQKFENLTYLDLSYSGLSINAVASPFAAASYFPDFFSIKLASCQLQTLPQFLANQSNLVYLDLSYNYIQGEIPRWIWTLEYLQYLNLSSNFFEGFETPPRNLTPALSVIDLHSNMLKGNMLPWPSYAMYLDFSINNITDVIPDNIGDYLSMTGYFSLSKNNFHGSILKSICKAYSLEVLDLSYNDMNETIPDCLVMASLKVLNLRNNQLNGGIPQNILGTCGLQTLDFSENLLRGQIPLWLANCTMLEVVNIRDNQIDGTFPCHFKVISSLRVVVLQSNKLHGEIGCPHSPGAWQKLQIIDLSSNDFGGMLPASLFASWEAMKANVDFDHLRYQYSQLRGVYYQDTMSVTVKGLHLELVKILTVFTSIDFSANRLMGSIPETLGDLKALYFLNLSRNVISGSIPPALGNLDQLESLDLSWNYLNGTIPAQFAKLDFLAFLNLSNNQLVGSIPDSGHFLTFSESSFEGNLGLCGLQLNKSCSTTTNGTDEAGSVPTQSDTDDDGDKDDSEKKWFYMGIPLGFVVGFWVFCGPLAFIKSWRFAYYGFWDKVLLRHFRP